MARRRNSIAKRFAKIRGLPAEEKVLMQRIADLLDATLNNRQSSNPFEPRRGKSHRQIYPPTGLLTKVGMKSVHLIWNAADSGEHLRYEITFDNLTTGERVTKTSYTNQVFYKASAGTYIARIYSVGRDGSSAQIQQSQFSVGDDVMQIEGAKNGPAELGTLVQDNILLLSGYSVYVWGSVVLDKFQANSSANNNNIVFRLYRAETPNASIADATLVETIQLYPATESAACLDATARAGLITRPSVPSGNARPGSFETSQSVMFSPLSISSADNNKEVTYFLQAINRELPNDEVNLSMVMWAGADGIGSAVPGDPFSPEPGYVFPHYNSFHSQTVTTASSGSNGHVIDARSLWASVPNTHALIANTWTIAMWIRFDDLNADTMSNAFHWSNYPTGGDRYILCRGAMRADEDQAWDEWRIWTGANNLGGGNYQHTLNARLGRSNRPGGEPTTRLWSISANTSGANNDESSGLWKWGDASNQTAAENDGWYFLVLCFGGGEYEGGVPKLRVYLNNIVAPVGAGTGYTANVTPYMQQLSPSSDGTTSKLTQSANQTHAYLIGNDNIDSAAGTFDDGIYNSNLRYMVTSGIQYHQLGIWNVALDSTITGPGNSMAQIHALYNAGRGHLVNWRENFTTGRTVLATAEPEAYNMAENLCHLIQFGAVEQAMSTGYPGRDTGFHLFNGDMNFTGTAVRFRSGWDYPDASSVTGHTGAHWTDNTTIADVLSPNGTNGTTAYDYAHPGQNMG